MKLQKDFLLKVPNNINLYYDTDKNLLICMNSVRKKSLKLKVKLYILEKSKLIFVTASVWNSLSKNGNLQQSALTKIRQVFLEISNTIYHKLLLVGVGYKALLSNSIKNLLILRLGFSHPIYIKNLLNININCAKSTNIFLSGNSSLADLTQFASFIKKHKPIEPYKGKGILYSNEKVTLKKGKKI